MSALNSPDFESNLVGHKAENLSISVVVPVYNSEKSLPELVLRLEPVLFGIADQFELILVNDGSRDQSWDVIKELTSERSWVTGINLVRNFGQHNALLCGIREARFEIIITLDDDLQNPPEEIPHLLEEIRAGFDVVYGTPKNEQHGFWRDMASQITKIALQTAMGSEVARRVSAFRAFKTSMRKAFAAYSGAYVNMDVLLSWATTRFSSVIVSHQPRKIGKSNYTFRKLAIHALNMITGFSVLPLQLASLMGFCFAILGALLLVYVLGRYLIEGGSVPGFPFLASTIVIFSGVQLLALGIIGEYMARIYFRVMDRPIYVIRQQIPTDAKE